MYHSYPTKLDPYNTYSEGVITDPLQVIQHSNGNLYVKDAIKGWANVHAPHTNLQGYGVRWFLDRFELARLPELS